MNKKFVTLKIQDLQNTRRGFTLIEIMIVLMIIGLLATLAFRG